MKRKLLRLGKERSFSGMSRLFFALAFFLPISIYAQTTLKGRVVSSDDGLGIPGASVYLEGTAIGTITNIDGEYEFVTSETGEYVLLASFVGYSTGKFQVNLNGGTIEHDFSLQVDLIGLDEIVVTGTANPKSKLESSIAISSISPGQIQTSGARSTADLYKTLPGVFVNASGGEGNANIEVRGNPNNGGGKFVQVQEDGLPVLPFSDLMFGNVDMFTRVDGTIDRVEVIRGGSAAILGSNSANGIINTISKTGRVEGGSIAQQIGLDWNHYRTDFEYGAPINDDLRFHLGGFYRSNEGVRETGYTANQGGQLKFNLTKEFKNGSVTFYTKYLNDNTTPYIPIPLARDGDPNSNKVEAKSLPGFSATHGTFHSVDLLRFKAQTPLGGLVEESLDGGMEPQLFSWGAKAQFDLGNGWDVSNNFRKSNINHEFNGIFSFSGQPVTAADYAASRGLTDYSFSYESGFGSGTPLTPAELANLNGNGLVVEYGYWNVDLPMDFFVNQFEINKYFDDIDLNITAGYYVHQFNLEGVWWWHNVLADVSDNTRRLNLVDNTTGQSLTVNGFSQFGSLYKNYQGQSRVNAPFMNFEWQPNDKINIDAGFRVDIGNVVAQTNVGTGSTFDYDANGDGVIAAAETGVAYEDGNFIPVDFNYDRFSYSLGINYKFNDNFASFLRHSKGVRYNFDRAFGFGATTDTRSGYSVEEEAGEQAVQYELGVKYKSSNLGFFITGFHTRYPDNIFQELVNTPQGLQTLNARGLIKVTGAEIEARAAFGDFNVSFNGTFFSRTYGDRNLAISATESLDLTGEDAPGVNSYFTLTPEYRTQGSKFYLGSAILWRGRFDDSDFDDTFFAPYWVFNPYVGSQVSDNISVMVQASNLFNEIGIDEGNPRSVTSAVGQNVFFARPLLGRSVQATVTYTF